METAPQAHTNTGQKRKQLMSVSRDMSGGARTRSPALADSQKTHSGAAKSDLTQEEFQKAIFNVSVP